MEQYAAPYGCAAILVGTFLEGETILVIGGFLAHRGDLELPSPVAVAFAGDQLFFFRGRRGGIAALEARPRWKARCASAPSALSSDRPWRSCSAR